jgi:D-galactarolactone cycloisomerase
MKITGVDSILVALPYEHGAPKPARHNFGFWETQDVLLIRIDTDAGITGWGEAFSFNGPSVTQAAVRDVLAPLAVGQNLDDPLDVAKTLHRRVYSIARAGPVAFALSGFDTALWDILGKQSGRPVWDLLGGKRKASVPAYASLHRLQQTEYVTKLCRVASERGYRQIKLHEYTVEAVAAARAAVGPDIALMVDTNCHWTSREDATAAARSFQPYDVMWLEEPLFPASDYEGMARLRREGGVPIAAGENLGDVSDLQRMLEAGAVDFAQPSVAKLGGISGVWKSLELAARDGVVGVPHSPFAGPALIATIHMVAALTNEVFCEHRFCDLGASVVGDWAVAKDGRLKVPDGPGLGVEIDMAVVEKYRVQ